MILLTYADVAKQLKVCVKTVQRLRAQKKITSVKIGTSIRFRQSDVDEYVRSCVESTEVAAPRKKGRPYQTVNW